jgi:hypothetical protein
MYIIRQTTLFAVLGFICISPSKHSRHSTDEVIRLTAPYSSISFTAGSCLSGHQSKPLAAFSLGMERGGRYNPYSPEGVSGFQWTRVVGTPCCSHSLPY